MSKSTKSRKARSVTPFGTELQSIIDNLDKCGDREVVIVGQALIEEALLVAIQSRLEVSFDPRLFDVGGPLANFWGCTTLGHAFGIIPSSLKSNLDTIGSIRNRCAHSVIWSGFDVCRDLCDQLDLHDTYPEVFQQILSKNPGAASDFETMDASKAMMFVDTTQAYLLGYVKQFTRDDLATPKGRYVVNARIAWFCSHAIRKFSTEPQG